MTHQTRSSPSHSEQACSTLEPQQQDGAPLPDDVVIALLGVTGAGKSTFIKNVTQRAGIQIGHNLTSETLECKAYRFHHSGVNFALVDTPGFNDTYLDDAAVLVQLAIFMEKTYRAHVRLTAIIYLHPITNNRLEGSALDNLSMFRKLCGPSCYPNVILATTFWSHVDPSVGRRREAELRNKEEFWGGMERRGSEIIQLPDERAQSLELLLRLAGKEKVVLQIQEELVDQGLATQRTEAGASTKNGKALEALQQEFLHNLDSLAAQQKAATQKQVADRARVRAEKDEAFQRQLHRHEQELASSRKEHLELLRRTELKQREALNEQDSAQREAEDKTRRLRKELAQLAIDEKQATIVRDRKNKHRARRARQQAYQSKIDGQIALFHTASVAGTIKQRGGIDSTWCSDPVLGRACDVCAHLCSARLSYKCGICVDCDICARCFDDEGERCVGDGTAWHTEYARRSCVGTEMGSCKRALDPPRTRFRVSCDACGTMLDGLFYHCCSCNADNYDLCVDCIIKGATCLNSSHVLHTMQT